MAHPSRHLFDAKPHRYVRAIDTDIRRTFRRARLLMRLTDRTSQRTALGGHHAAAAAAEAGAA